MAVKGRQRFSAKCLNERGQSVLEFLLVLPLLVAIALLMIRVNTVIQISIVDQKYARAQMTFVNGNGASYPRRANVIKDMATGGSNQLILGVSDNRPDDTEGGSSGQTVATTYYIARKKGQGSDNPQEEPPRRANIRVRNTITICLPLVSVGGQPVLDPMGTSTARYNLPEDPKQWDFCSSSQEQII